MEWLITILLVLLILLLIGAVLLGGLLLLYCGGSALLDLWNRPDDIRNMRSFPDGTMFTAHSRAAEETFRKIEPMLRFTEASDFDELPVRVGTELAEKLKASRRVLEENGLCRRLRFLDLRLEEQKNGSCYRKWNDGGREWQAGELTGAMLETYTDAGGNELAEARYAPTAEILYTMSRRLRPEELEKASAKDKWGRKLYAGKSFYTELGLKNCPSCGAPLPQDLKDVVCPHCGSTIYADYYDWQVESIDIVPETAGKTVDDLFGNRKPGQTVVYAGKKLRKRIVRFSENDFRKDVLAACRAEEDGQKLLDLYLGTVKIRTVRNTENETYLGIRVPVYRTVLDGTGAISAEKETRSAEFVRTRYPGRFNRRTAVISAEKACPNCGGPFSPDEKGNCAYCGSFLFKDDLRWKKAGRIG